MKEKELIEKLNELVELLEKEVPGNNPVWYSIISLESEIKALESEIKQSDPMKDLRQTTDKAVKFINDKGIYFDEPDNDFIWAKHETTDLD